MPELEAENLSFKRRKKMVLDHVGCKISGITGIAGPNGSGKSTLLKLLAGVLKPDFGQVRYQQQDLAGVPDKVRAKMVAYLPQILPGNCAFRVTELLAMGRYAHGDMREEHPAVQQVLSVLELEHLKDRRIDQLSGGEQRLVYLGLCLVTESPVLLLDEPEAGLDLYHRQRLWEIILSSGRPVAVVSHDLATLSQVCQKLILLDHGKVCAEGDIREVLTPETLSQVFHVGNAAQFDFSLSCK